MPSDVPFDNAINWEDDLEDDDYIFPIISPKSVDIIYVVFRDGGRGKLKHIDWSEYED